MPISGAPLVITRASVRHEKIPVDHAVKTSFGVMTTRHALLLILEDEKGRVGVGESWVNFPLWAPWERSALFKQGFIPYLQQANVSAIPEFITGMYRDFLGPAMQSGTTAPLIQALCAVELALWDLLARREELPLAHCLFEHPAPAVRVYASGINSPIPWDLMKQQLDAGVALFKLKLGFGIEEDRANLEQMAGFLDGKAEIAVDVNRGWTVGQAMQWLPVLRDHSITWLEEPLKPSDEIHLPELRAASEVPVAGGENIWMPPGADASGILESPLDVIQPDLTKNTPLHIAMNLLHKAAGTAKRIVPHFLGSAPGQAASIHFAAGCPEALVEMDINRNPLRTGLFTEPFIVENGKVKVPEKPGLGWTLGKLAACAVLALMQPANLSADDESASKAPAGESRIYKQSGGEPRKLELFFPPDHDATKKVPALILFHGGGWRAGSLAQFREACAYFASRGLVCATAEYRLVKGKEAASLPGGESRKRLCITDAKSAIRWLKQNAKELGIDPDRIIAGGGSAGGHISALGTLNPGLNDPADPEGIDTSVVAYVWFNPALEPEDANDPEVDVLRFVRPDLPPAIVFFGSRDPWKRGWDVASAKWGEVGEKSIDLRIAEGEKHGFFNHEPWMSVTLIAADRFLAGQGLLEGEPTRKAPEGAAALKQVGH